MRDGYGEYKYMSGHKYIGEFKNGLSEGNGKMIYPDGDVFTGAYKQDK
jgi:hypothetical protein